MAHDDIPYFAKDLKALLGIKHTNTLRMRIRDGRIPPPDVQVTLHTRYWHRSTLVKAGLLLPTEPKSDE